GPPAYLHLFHLRPRLDAPRDVHRDVDDIAPMSAMRPRYSFLSVTEAGMYHLSAKIKDEAELASRIAAERETPHVQRRLYPSLPDDMPYVCFYPMTKRRDPGANWYALTLEERSQLMQAHGTTGRRY